MSRYVQTKVGEHHLWQDPYGRVKEALRGGQLICDRWTTACEALTTQFWKRFGPHPWKGDKFVPVNVVKLNERLEEVIQSLVLHT